MNYLHYLSLVLLLLKGMNFIDIPWIMVFLPILILGLFKLVISVSLIIIKRKRDKAAKRIEEIGDYSYTFTEDTLKFNIQMYDRLKEILEKMMEI